MPRARIRDHAAMRQRIPLFVDTKSQHIVKTSLSYSILWGCPARLSAKVAPTDVKMSSKGGFDQFCGI